MAYDEGLEKSIDEVIDKWDVGLDKKKLFGGIGYLVNGNLAFGVHNSELLVRADESQGKKLLDNNGVRHFEMGGRKSIKNWYLVDLSVSGESIKLSCYLEIGLDYAQSLPKKK